MKVNQGTGLSMGVWHSSHTESHKTLYLSVELILSPDHRYVEAMYSGVK